jgi:hypothetical protein
VNIVKADIRGNRSGRLVGLTRNRVTAVLGFVSNVADDPVKVGRAWGFEADGVPAAVWRYKDSPNLSYFGPEDVFVRLFGREHVVHESAETEVPF